MSKGQDLRQKSIKLYYFRSKGLINFGDDLSPKLVEMVTGKTVEWAHPTRCDLAGLGSILQRLVKHRRKRIVTAFGRKISVWGSGFIDDTAKATASDFDFLAVRGPNTAGLINGLSQPVFGDPGLLFSQLAPKPVGKQFKWGIIPHYNDMDDPRVAALVSNTPSATLISVRDDPIATLYKIKSCEYILSSSLHGLVAADCFRIPNWRLKLGDRIVGGDFKFEDYAAPIGRANIKPLQLTPSGTLDINKLALDGFDYFDNISPVAGALHKALIDKI